MSNFMKQLRTVVDLSLRDCHQNSRRDPLWISSVLLFTMAVRFLTQMGRPLGSWIAPNINSAHPCSQYCKRTYTNVLEEQLSYGDLFELLHSCPWQHSASFNGLTLGTLSLVTVLIGLELKSTRIKRFLWPSSIAMLITARTDGVNDGHRTGVRVPRNFRSPASVAYTLTVEKFRLHPLRS